MGCEQVWLSYNQLFIPFFFLYLCQITCLHAQLCTQEQNSALLQLKGSFSLDKSASCGMFNIFLFWACGDIMANFLAPSTTPSYFSCFSSSSLQSLCLGTPFGYRNRRTMDITDWVIH
ncbi:hypothetical protein RHSIM_Rhsim01G0066100 [Rhododendron simsii]|uniref:Uncharacterized protein n=1 Tax=Rhododendron simsii TaxID=118357 RepID=A0A834LYU7_RHOSS|nr:hypothetical protein RHSIM_Rhsim01G0066100 [Rhododendron simsii]